MLTAHRYTCKNLFAVMTAFKKLPNTKTVTVPIVYEQLNWSTRTLVYCEVT